MARHIVMGVVLLLTACANSAMQGTAGNRPVAEEFGQLRKGFVDAYARADADAVAAFYAADATYIGTAGDVVTGRDRLVIGLRREVPVFRQFQVEPAQFGSSGELAWERGTYRAALSIPGRPPEPILGPYLIVYERSAAKGWQIKQHMTGRTVARQ